MTRHLPILADSDARSILSKACEDHGVSIELVERLIDIQRENLGRGRQIGISEEFSAAITDFLEVNSEEKE